MSETSVTFNTRVPKDLHREFRHKAKTELGKSAPEMIREMMQAFVEDRIQIKPKGKIYVS